jgi:hypothetical protein
LQPIILSYNPAGQAGCWWDDKSSVVIGKDRIAASDSYPPSHETSTQIRLFQIADSFSAYLKTFD